MTTGKAKIQARLLDDPPLWCWELVDSMTCRVIASSWSDNWEAYGSRDEALRAGREASEVPNTPGREAA
jgi:hypothetical protein